MLREDNEIKDGIIIVYHFSMRNLLTGDCVDGVEFATFEGKIESGTRLKS